SMSTATQNPCETSATMTATSPETKAPTIGTNPPRKTNAAIANSNGTPSSQAPKPIPTASTRATSTVARINDVNEFHAVMPDVYAFSRASLGNSATAHE